MSILDPESDFAAIVRRDNNASKALPSVIEACKGDMLEGRETHAQMFARVAYDIADAMERERKARQKGGEA